MAADPGSARLTVAELAQRFRHEMVPLSNTFSYFFLATPPTEDDIREYLEEPIASLPPRACALLPKVYVFLVPYLEKENGKEKAGAVPNLTVTMEKPSESRAVPSSAFPWEEGLVFVLAIRDQEVAEYHYRLFRLLAGAIRERLTPDVEKRFNSLLLDELSKGVHGEVDEESWRLKQALLRRITNVRRENKTFRAYAARSFVDTLTLYFHGICCDIDVDTGPRQLPSRYLRKRLLLLEELYPPPEGYAVFPENLAAEK